MIGIIGAMAEEVLEIKKINGNESTKGISRIYIL